MVESFSGYVQNNHINNHVIADVIILGCSLPGIVTAHKLKKKFGDSMEIVVLDLATTRKNESKCNVAFQEDPDEEREDNVYEGTTDKLDNVARFYLALYSKEFNIPIPDEIIDADFLKTDLKKLFECTDGSVIDCTNNFYDFDYLNFLERFELNQYQDLLDQYMRNLFHTHKIDDDCERQQLLYYDRTTMEQHLCNSLLFSLSREIMRIAVRVVCGAAADSVSVLFYLHQCYRSASARNHLDGDNTRLREKLLGFCRKRLTSKLQQSVANITYPAKTIKEIRSYSQEQVILNGIKGETSYICSLLAMALRPDQLKNIQMGSDLLSGKEYQMASTMSSGKARKFVIQYEQCFWRRCGYSGDILSLRGPIIWATERPRMSTTGSQEKFALVGFLKVNDNLISNEEAVVAQLIRLFGEEAGDLVSYKETNIEDVFVPRCGDYVGLRKLTTIGCRLLEWGALDVFAEGDVAAALEAGHTAYLNLLRCLRPQAQTYEELSAGKRSTLYTDSTISRWIAEINIMKGVRLSIYSSLFYLGLRILQSFLRK